MGHVVNIRDCKHANSARSIDLPPRSSIYVCQYTHIYEYTTFCRYSYCTCTYESVYR